MDKQDQILSKLDEIQRMQQMEIVASLVAEGATTYKAHCLMVDALKKIDVPCKLRFTGSVPVKKKKKKWWRVR